MPFFLTILQLSNILITLCLTFILFPFYLHLQFYLFTKNNLLTLLCRYSANMVIYIFSYYSFDYIVAAAVVVVDCFAVGYYYNYLAAVVDPQISQP